MIPSHMAPSCLNMTHFTPNVLFSFFDMSSASGYIGAKYVQELGPSLFEISSASGCVGEKYFRKSCLNYPIYGISPL